MGHARARVQLLSAASLCPPQAPYSEDGGDRPWARLILPSLPYQGNPNSKSAARRGKR